MGNTFSMTHPRLTSFKHKSAPLKSKNVVLLKPEIFSPKMKTPLRAGLCVEFERKNNDLNDINEIKEIKESLLNLLIIFKLFNILLLFSFLFPLCSLLYGGAFSDRVAKCADLLAQREVSTV